PPDLIDHVGRVVHHDHSTRAEHRAIGLNVLVVGGAVLDFGGAHDGDRGTARDDRFERPAGPHAACQLRDQVLHRKAERELVVAGLLYVTADRDELGPWALGAAHHQALIP